MLTLLRPISLRRLTEHKLRAAMTAVGISLGVAVLVAVVTVNAGIVGSFSDTLDRISGRVDLEVRGGDTGLDEMLVDKALEVPGVKYATPVIERTLDLADGTGETLAILGINFTEDPKALQHLYQLDAAALKRPAAPDKPKNDDEFADDPFAMLDQPRQLVVTTEFAAKHHLQKGGTIELLTPVGRQTFTAFSIVEAKGPQKAMGGNLAIMDYVDAQEVFGLKRRVDRLDIALDDAKQPGEVARAVAALKRAVGQEYDVERPGKRQARQEQLLKSFKLALAIGAGVALIVGMFLIYHTLSITVAQRRSEIGILRAAGATRRQIVALFTVEGLLFGLGGSLLGLALGGVLARGMMETSAQSVTDLYLRVHIQETRVAWSTMFFGLLLGTVSSGLASLLPAWQASRLSPVDTIRTVAFDFRGVPTLRWEAREFGALGCYALAPLVAQGPPIGGFPVFGLMAMFLIVLGTTLLSRWLMLLLTRVLGPLATRFGGIEGRLAADNVTRGANKSAVTVASLMVGLSMVMGSAILTTSFRHSIQTWIEQTVPADLFITSNANMGGIKNQPVDFALAAEIAKLPGVASVDTVRLRNVDFKSSRVLLLSLQTKIRFQHTSAWPISRCAGDCKTVTSRLTAGEGVVISETLSHRFGTNPGETIGLQTAHGLVEFPVLAAMRDYSSDQGAVFMDRALYLKHWDDDKVDTFEPYMKPGVDPKVVREQVLAKWGKKYRLFALTNAEFRDEIGQMIDRLFSITRALELVTIFISLLSVVNTLLTAILDRMREIGVLRAVGMKRNQLVRVILTESLILALIGAAIGIVVGTVNGLIILKVVNAQDTGWDVPLNFPVHLALLYASALVVVGVLAAIYPARVAARVPVVDALNYE